MTATRLVDSSGRFISDPDYDTLRSAAQVEEAAHPRWNESAWFGFSIPERNINGFFYYWHRPNMGLVTSQVALWDGNDDHRGDCIYYDWQPYNPRAAEVGMFDMRLESGMSVRLREPLTAYELRYDAPGCRLDLLWEGVAPAYNLSWTEESSEDDKTRDWGSFHYEQFGHVTGSVVIDGERYDVDCHHIRDRSWGVRKPFPPHMRGGADMGWISDDLAFCITSATPDATDATADVDPVMYGMMIKDGAMSFVTGGQRRVTQRGPDGQPQRLEIEAHDDDGRELRIAGRSTNCLRYADQWLSDWCLVDWEVDGRHGWGEIQDFAASDTYRRRRRGARS